MWKGRHGWGKLGGGRLELRWRHGMGNWTKLDNLINK